MKKNEIESVEKLHAPGWWGIAAALAVPALSWAAYKFAPVFPVFQVVPVAGS